MEPGRWSLRAYSSQQKITLYSQTDSIRNWLCKCGCCKRGSLGGHFCSFQGGSGTEPEPETGTVGTVFPETESGTGTAGTVFQEPKPEPEPSFPVKLY